VTGPFQRVHHVCIVVRDIDAAQRYYESVGIGPWHDYPPLSGFSDLRVPDREGFLGLTYRYAWIGEFQIQLVQPGPHETPQRRFLDEHGEGVFHIGFEVADADAADGQAAALGLRAMMRGRRPDGSGFTYFDTADAAGVVLEIRQSQQG
jgi:catechol 2,3-dioxygenase-like lactoylglutathione lyase family enzyme